ncbi:hypothetical protein [Granulosicoccus antarcticus]|uniref:hypothetical protein n=1 Tax=Granulosicoccus antarcticus TaxID=437505 RepID=UPI0012FDE93F|nr:hypothetical protein [Granulosicoccus antarcticus]
MDIPTHQPPSAESYYSGPGRLIPPQSKLTFSMSINEAVKSRIEAALHILEATT